MKRLLLLTLPFLVLLSCGRAPLQETATVSFVARPDLQTKAVSDGNTVNQLYVCVFDQATGEELPQFRTCVSRENGRFAFSLNLATGNSYNLAFWAQAEDGPYTLTDGDVTAITADYTAAVASDEKGDAFRAVETVTVDRDMAVNVTLTRAVAMLDFLSDESLDNLPGDVETAVTLQGGVAASYNALTAVASDPLAEAVRFDFAAVPGDELVEENYQYTRAAFVYVLPAASALQKVVLTPRIGGKVGADRESTDVPVAANWRTKLKGTLFTY